MHATNKSAKLPVLVTLLKWLLQLLKLLYTWLLYAIALLSYPLGLLQNRLQGLLAPKCKQLIPEAWNTTFRKCNGFLPFVLLLSVLVGEILFFVAIFLFTTQQDEIILLLLTENLSVASVLFFFRDGMDWNLSAVFAIALSGHLICACIGSLNSETEDPETGKKLETAAPWYIRIPALLIYTVMATILAYYLSGVFDAVGGWAGTAVATLSNYENAGFFSIALKVCALIPIGYFLILLILIAIKEYGETIFFGSIGFGLFFVFVLVYGLIGYFCGIEEFNQELTMVILLITVIGAEIFRHHFAEKLESRTQENVDAFLHRLFKK